MECNKYVFECIADTRTELQYLKEIGTKAEQFECFKRLIELYTLLNVQEGIGHITKKIERAAS